MTTSVSVKTHAWPAKITITDRHGDSDPATSEETVPPNSERTVHLTQTRSIAFEELPLPTEQSSDGDAETYQSDDEGDEDEEATA